MGSPCTRRAWSGSMMALFGCGTQVSRSGIPTSRPGSARRDSPAPSRPRYPASSVRHGTAYRSHEGSALRVSSSSSLTGNKPKAQYEGQDPALVVFESTFGHTKEIAADRQGLAPAVVD